MSPEKINQFDFGSLSADEMAALINVLTDLHKERVNRDKRRKKAEEYEIRIYDLISETQHSGFNVAIDGKYISKDCAVEVEFYD